MSISFNHTIVAAHDKQASAAFLAELFGLPEPQPLGHFHVVGLDHDASLDYAEVPAAEEIRPQHYAFLVSEADFDAIYAKICSRGLAHWADPGGEHPGEINQRDGGRGVYFRDPAGHYMEILTRPYGSGGQRGSTKESRSWTAVSDRGQRGSTKESRSWTAVSDPGS